MIRAFIFLLVALICYCFYLYDYKKASILIVFHYGFILGISKWSEPLDEGKINNLDIYLGFVILSFVYEE